MTLDMAVHLIDHSPQVSREVSLHGRWQAAWQERAACAGHDTDEFFAESRKTIPEEIQASWPQLLLCFACPVRRECLEQSFVQDSTRDRDEFGIFGGATPGMRDEALFDPMGIENILSVGEWEAALMMSAPVSEGVAA